jgi:hypothetical protein
MAYARTYCDEDLIRAVSMSTSWRQTLRRLNLRSSSGRMIESVRRHAQSLDLSVAHFRTGLAGRAPSRSYNAGGDQPRGVDELLVVSPESAPAVTDPTLEAATLPRAGTLLAAAWYALQGGDISWPLEPCRYDFLVGMSGAHVRVQVKTTTVPAGRSWKVYLSTSRRTRHLYAVTEIDEFFIVARDLTCFRIPLREVAGVHALHLGGYQRFRVAFEVPNAAPTTLD